MLERGPARPCFTFTGTSSAAACEACPDEPDRTDPGRAQGRDARAGQRPPRRVAADPERAPVGGEGAPASAERSGGAAGPPAGAEEAGRGGGGVPLGGPRRAG